jgi:plasmid maintenance system antidote protein VapI
MKKTTLARLAGMTAQQVYNINSGRSCITLKVAMKFEEITGIASYKWTHPDQFGDAWSELLALPEPNK